METADAMPPTIRSSDARRPGGPVPTIIVSLTGLTFNFGSLNFGLNGIGIPPFNTSTFGEDLKTSYL